MVENWNLEINYHKACMFPTPIPQRMICFYHHLDKDKNIKTRDRKLLRGAWLLVLISFLKNQSYLSAHTLLFPTWWRPKMPMIDLWTYDRRWMSYQTIITNANHRREYSWHGSRLALSFIKEILFRFKMSKKSRCSMNRTSSKTGYPFIICVISNWFL